MELLNVLLRGERRREPRTPEARILVDRQERVASRLQVIRAQAHSAGRRLGK